jgi:carbonic anhydrase
MSGKDIWLSIQPFLDEDETVPLTGESRVKLRQVIAGTDRAYTVAKDYKIKAGFILLPKTSTSANTGAIGHFYQMSEQSGGRRCRSGGRRNSAMCNDCLEVGLNRRHLVLGGAGLLATASLIGTAQAQPARAADTPDAALRLLVDGNARYVANEPRERDFSAGRANSALGQAPFAAILGCADSRVSPELAFDQAPGDLFVVRVAGNFVTTYGLASLEFGAAVLGTKLIMVLGHSSCGAVNATVAALQKHNNLPGHIAELVRAMKPGIEEALKQSGDDLEHRAVVANVRYNVQRLQHAKPILADMVVKGQVRVVGAVYDLASGKVTLV